MLVNPSMKEKYPYWYAQVEREEKQREIDNMLFMAQIQLSQFVDEKMKDIDNKVREIEERVRQADYNVITTINNKPMENNSAINREIKKMLVKELEKALNNK